MPAHSRSKNGVASLAYVAGIHVLSAASSIAKTWMAGTSPAMTSAPFNLSSSGSGKAPKRAAAVGSAIPAEGDLVEHARAELFRRTGDGFAAERAIKLDRGIVFRQRPHDQ